MKVLIADDHWMIRASLKQAISSIDSTLQIVDASSFDEATNMLAEHHDIDLMLIDLVMPGFSDLDGLRRLRSSYPDVPVAVISVHEDRDHVLRAISEGVIAYIPKSAEGAELLRALSLILNGGVYFPRDILQGNSFRSQLPDSKPAASEAAEPSVALTSREEQIFLLLGEGRSTSAVAKELGLSPNTVRVHLRNMNLKLNIKTRDELRSFLAARRQSTKQVPG
jgi:DNA-binding NarL/FixJ family response regulator